MPLTDPDRAPPSNPLRRLLWLLLCFAVGLGVAIAGRLLSGSSAWALAVPVAIAIGWLFVADPTQCMPAKRSGPQRLKADREVDRR